MSHNSHDDAHKLPPTFKRMKENYPELMAAYDAMARAAETAGPLTKREQRLVKLGLAIGARLEGGTHSAVRKALEAGVKPEEVKQAALLAITTLGFPAAMAGLSWVRDIVEPDGKASS